MPAVVRACRRFTQWLTDPTPGGRIAALRTVVYLFIPADLLYFTPWIRGHGHLPGELYQPLLIGRLLPLPVPTEGLVHGVWLALLITAPLAATGRFPRLLGWTIFILYFEWMIIGFSYGKVDHDRIGFLVALAVLPTLARARHGDRTLTEAGGWAVRMIQLAVIGTYFLSAIAKLTYGAQWLTGATLVRAVLRRGDDWYSWWTLDHPELLVVAQWLILGFELATPVVFLVGPRLRYLMIGGLYGFHAMTMLAVGIAFWPHLVAMLSFFPLERVRPLHRLGLAARRVLGRRARPQSPASRTPARSRAPA